MVVRCTIISFCAQRILIVIGERLLQDMRKKFYSIVWHRKLKLWYYLLKYVIFKFFSVSSIFLKIIDNLFFEIWHFKLFIKKWYHLPKIHKFYSYNWLSNILHWYYLQNFIQEKNARISSQCFFNLTGSYKMIKLFKNYIIIYSISILHCIYESTW